MSDSERSFLTEQLELTKKNMLASINGLTDAQWKFKPAPRSGACRNAPSTSFSPRISFPALRKGVAARE